MNSDVFLGTMGSVAEPELGLRVSSFPATSPMPPTPGNISHSSVLQSSFIIIPMMNANTFQLHSEASTHHSPTLSSEKRHQAAF